MVDLPCLHITGHIPFASRANIHIPFRNDLRIPHLETVITCAPVIYLARAYTAPHRLLASGTNILETLAFPPCLCSICQQRHRLRRAALALLLAADFCLACLCFFPFRRLLYVALLAAGLPAFGRCPLFSVFVPRWQPRHPVVARTALCLSSLSSRWPRPSSGPSVLISVRFSCLGCFAFGSASFIWELSCSLLRFRSAMASQTSAMARTFFSSAAVLATFACVAATRCTALLMVARGMGHFQQLLQTWSPLQERCCMGHGDCGNFGWLLHDGL